MQENLLSQGLELMVFGMGTVIVFLAALVVSTGWMSFLINRFFPEPEPEVAQVTPVAVQDKAVDAKTVAVITAAIAQHRRMRH